MNIDEFKATMNKFGGTARPNLFSVEILNTGSSFIEDRDLRMFCKNAAIPGINLATQSYKPFAHGPEITMPSGFQHEPLNCVFMLDSAHAVMSFFHNWMQKIINFDTSKGLMGSVDNAYPYELSYRDEYAVTIRIKFFSPFSNDYFYEVVMRDAYPTAVGQVSLSWEENDSYAVMPVSFTYSEILFSSTVISNPSEQYSRSNGYIQRLAELASAQTISQSGLPRTIQDAIDRYTNIKNTFNRVKRILR